MQATTIKIENPLLDELRSLTPRTKSLSGFIREILEQEIQRRKMIQAAEKYADFLKSSPGEREWLEEWESADLSRAPRYIRKRKKS
jgi:hypothetical protein